MSNSDMDINNRRQAFELRKQKIEELKKSGNENEAKAESDSLKNDKHDFYIENVLKRDAVQGGVAEISAATKRGKNVIANLADGNVTAADVKNFNGYVSGLSLRVGEIDGKISVLSKLKNKKSKAIISDLMLKKRYLKAIKENVQKVGSKYIEGSRGKSSNDSAVPLQNPNNVKVDNKENTSNDFSFLDAIAKEYFMARAKAKGFYNQSLSVAGKSLDGAKDRLKELMKKTRNPDKPVHHNSFSADRAKELLLKNQILSNQVLGR